MSIFPLKKQNKNNVLSETFGDDLGHFVVDNIQHYVKTIQNNLKENHWEIKSWEYWELSGVV